MFTGIVQGTATVERVEQKTGYTTIVVRLPFEHLAKLEVGASVAIDGVCLTVVSIQHDFAEFDIITNSLKLTTLDCLKPGDRVNYERSLTEGAEIGGHLLSGHVDFAGVVSGLTSTNGSFGLTVSFDPQWKSYLFEKGFVGINGASLTVSDVNKIECNFTCWIIPETLRRTNIAAMSVGSKVNIEIDRQTQVLVDTIRTVAEEKFGALSDVLHDAIERLGIVPELRGKITQTLEVAPVRLPQGAEREGHS